MISRATFLGLLAFALIGLRPAGAVEQTLKRSFPVRPGSTLTVDTYRGAITVEEAEGNEVRTEVRIELATEDEAEAAQGLEALKLEMTEVDGGVRVQARNPRESRALFAWEEKKRIELTFRVAVPKGCTVDLSTRDGAVTVGNFRGRVVAHTRAGTIFCRKVDGTIKATADLGDVVVSHCTGAVELRVQRGNIRVGTIFGRADLHNDSGDIEILSAMGGVSASTSAGDVTVGLQKGFTGDAKIDADGGNIYAKIDPSAGLALQASTSWGKVQTKLPFAVETGGAGKNNFTGKLNGGGPRVQLHAAGGHVKLEAYQQFLNVTDEG